MIDKQKQKIKRLIVISDAFHSFRNSSENEKQFPVLTFPVT